MPNPRTPIAILDGQKKNTTEITLAQTPSPGLGWARVHGVGQGSATAIFPGCRCFFHAVGMEVSPTVI